MAEQDFRRPVSVVLAEALGDGRGVTVGEITDRVAHRGFGLLLVILALPTLIPVLPPGAAATVGLLYVLLALQMLWGLERPWLPARVRAYRLGAHVVSALRSRGVPFLQRIERFSRPRGPVIDQRLLTRSVALIVLALGIVLFGPLPFLNTVPALSALLMGAGLLNRDLLFVLVGLVIAAVVALVIVFGLGTLYVLLDWVRGR
jgi:hypothetical protein